MVYGQESRTLSEAEVVPLGLAPRPSTSEGVGTRLRSALLDALTADASGVVRSAEKLTVETEISGADIVTCIIDVTGVDVLLRDVDSPAVERPEPLAAVIHSEPGMLGRGTFTGYPLIVQGVPVEVRAEAERVPFAWLTLADGRLVLAPSFELPGRFGKPVFATFRAGVNPHNVVVPLMEAMRRQFSDVNALTTDQAKIRLKQLGSREVAVDFRVRVKWKIFRPRFRFRTRLAVDQHFVLRLRRTSVTSSNPLLGVVLRLYRRRMNDELNAPIDLKEALQPATLRKLRVEAGDSKLIVEMEVTL